MEKILISDTKSVLERSLGMKDRQLNKLVSEICGDGLEIIYEVNLPTCSEYISSGEVVGLIIPHGHGASNTIYNLRNNLGRDIPIPIFKAYDKCGGRMYDSVRNWLKDDVVKE